MLSTEASIDEELGLGLVGWHRQGLSDGRAERDPKRSGRGRSGSDPDHVLHFLLWDAEVVGDVRHPATRHETVDQVLHARAAVKDERETERALRIHDHPRALVSGKPHPLRPTIVAVADSLQVVAHRRWPVRTTVSSRSSPSSCSAA